ncbi:MAG: response regulator [Acidobacteriota bacterium]|nr:response regulator [Acidobacteriota bacterium]
MSPSSIPHLLLIDDNRDGLLVRRTLLEEAGCTVAVAHSGEEGLDLFGNTGFDLTVTDFRMPGGIDGMEVIRRIRAIDGSARIILLSGFVEPLGLTEQNTGADAVIAKSSREAAHLVRAVKRLLTQAVRKPPSSQRAAARRVSSTAAGR